MGDALDGHAIARCLELGGKNERKKEKEVAAVEEQRTSKQ
jgi:hypothetical protein